ncbi:DUF397 domain-containing protein [Saccharothrix coeruleofusca]|uniref:DUF397 domain-containing protein n=1 Tax=Saccharothrix coeruleofusca TaxID=33919 RepID=A0A918EFW9_9PSEU|nr:DUF397 domain-containing protein [Saccharothrix coeruleofusca]MBP2335353.1 hypothetical protein [Saccharothrix coeruleofusca]GGP77306.1 hypothetical protein GCM10010185_58710 [Saccharothrix coeruleofusca]
MAPDTTWRKSSHSGGNGGDCVEVAHRVSRTLVRDSKNPDGPVLGFGAKSFTGFLVALKGA